MSLSSISIETVYIESVYRWVQMIYSTTCIDKRSTKFYTSWGAQTTEYSKHYHILLHQIICLDITGKFDFWWLFVFVLCTSRINVVSTLGSLSTRIQEPYRQNGIPLHSFKPRGSALKVVPISRIANMLRKGYINKFLLQIWQSKMNWTAKKNKKVYDGSMGWQPHTLSNDWRFNHMDVYC